MKLKGGFTNYGEQIGILMLDTTFPRPAGDIGNALSYDFPVRYKTVRGATSNRIMGDIPEGELLQPFIDAARELEAEGVKAITTSCGFLAPFQKQISAAVDIPVFVSSLIQAPLIQALLAPGKTIGIFTERAEHLNEDHFQGVGWSSKDIRVFVQGMKSDAIFPATYIGGRREIETDHLKEEMLEMTRDFMKSCSNPGAILFECTNMCPFSSFVAEESGLPIFDVNTLMNYFVSASTPRKYF